MTRLKSLQMTEELWSKMREIAIGLNELYPKNKFTRISHLKRLAIGRLKKTEFNGLLNDCPTCEFTSEKITNRYGDSTKIFVCGKCPLEELTGENCKGEFSPYTAAIKAANENDLENLIFNIDRIIDFCHAKIKMEISQAIQRTSCINLKKKPRVRFCWYCGRQLRGNYFKIRRTPYTNHKIILHKQCAELFDKGVY